MRQLRKAFDDRIAIGSPFTRSSQKRRDRAFLLALKRQGFQPYRYCLVIDSLRYALNVTDVPSDAIVGRSKILELIARVEKLEKKAEGDYRATDERLSEIEQRDRQIAEMQQRVCQVVCVKDQS